MYPSRAFATVVLGLAAALAPRGASAAATPLSTDYRHAAQADKQAAQGGGTLSESAVLPRGLRLAAPDAKGEKSQAAATAIYLFKVSPDATSFTIEVGYRADAATKDKGAAGLLFVRNSRPAGGKPIEPQNRPVAQKPEAAPSGDLYPLKGAETTASFTVPSAGRVVDGALEVHLVAQAGQAFDALYVQVESHRAADGYAGRGSYQVPQVPSGRPYDPLNYGQPPPLAGCGVPNLYPNLYGAGHATSQDPIFWNQVWQMQRPHMYNLYPYPYPYHGGHGHGRHGR